MSVLLNVIKTNEKALREMQTLHVGCSTLTLPYGEAGKACYRLALRPPVGPMHIPELTVRLLKPLGVFSKLQE